MSQYRAYPAYKDSGVEWIGQVPEHWEVKPICRVTSVNDDVLPDSTTDDTLIRYVDISSVGYMEGIKQASDMCFVDAPSRARRKASSGDVIISTVRTYLKAVAAVTDEYADCVFSTGFAVLRARHLDRSFLRWMVLNELLIQAIEAHSEGLSYPAINASALVKLKSVIPPPEEQAAIAATLDRETARIDALIEKKTRFIELLKEKRQTLITHAVTKGLDLHVKVKDSGVEWIGQVPEHWEVKPICRVTSVNDDVLPDSTTDDTLIRYVDISSVGYMEGIKQASDMCFVDAPSRARRKASSGDVIISTVRTYLKAVAAVTDEYADCVFSTGFAVLRARHLDRSFLRWMVLNELLIQAIEAHSEGLSYPAINASALVKLKSVIPPPEEQAAIAATLDRETARIDALIGKAEQSITLLKERRAAFITAAVTGQIDLRGKQ
ncbi:MULTISPECIES: restriction endonuclease subunit S [Pseudomonas]|uniref:restriction endonuclease subunit S n=1 Tax=Pseudomonas TaxID=286 RepID=UPI000F78F400|nr:MULTISPECIES: restriction endonuclease subunit S [Pseudomonas]RRW43211.1 restriction endonuclease subunit S [Pseudomonas luteola]